MEATNQCICQSVWFVRGQRQSFSQSTPLLLLLSLGGGRPKAALQCNCICIFAFVMSGGRLSLVLGSPRSYICICVFAFIANSGRPKAALSKSECAYMICGLRAAESRPSVDLLLHHVMYGVRPTFLSRPKSSLQYICLLIFAVVVGCRRSNAAESGLIAVPQ